MRIQRKIDQHRRDFRAIYECEHCGAETKGAGYDDTYFHQHVIPAMQCTECGETADESTPKTTPDVATHVVI